MRPVWISKTSRRAAPSTPSNEDDRDKRHDDSGQQPAKYQNGVDRYLDVGAAWGL